MPSRSLELVISHVRKIAATPSTESSDGDLLRAFLELRDEFAFATIVRRHGSLVRLVCRQVLACEHDVDDAFQATFLVLAKKANSVRKSNSLASWLHGVALRIALNARKASQRRQTREQNWAQLPKPPWDNQTALRELQMIVAEEVDRLSENLRTPFVLCCLEGKGKAEAAQELGWKVGTVSGRLARARQQLRIRLRRRGVDLSVALCATALLGEAARGSSQAQMSTLAKAALQLVSGKSTSIAGASTAVIILANSFTRPRVDGVLFLLLSILSLSMAGAFAATRLVNHQDISANFADSDLQATLPLDNSQSPNAPVHLSASGSVVDEAGRPIDGATVYLTEMTILRDWEERQRPNYTDILAQVKTNARGKFRFKDAAAGPLKRNLSGNLLYRHPWQVVVLAKGYGLVWHQFQSHQEVDLKLTMFSEFPLRGRLVDGKGKPVAGVAIRAGQITDQLDPDKRFRKAPDESIYLKDSHLPLTAVTGADGEFVLHGQPRERVVSLVADHPRFARKWLSCATIDNGEIAAFNRAVSVRPSPIAAIDPKLLPDGFTAILGPRLTIHGKVRFGDTGKPAAGVRITVGTIEVITDREGKYLFDALEARTYTLFVHASERMDYLDSSGTVEIPADKFDWQRDFVLERGAIVSGQLRDKDSKAAIAEPYVDVHLEAAEPMSQGRVRTLGRASTKADGSYRIIARPGKGRVATFQSITGYLPRFLSDEDVSSESDSFELKPGDSMSGKDIFLNKGTVVIGRVLDPQGKPVAGAVFKGGTVQSPSRVDGTFTLSGLSGAHASQFFVLEPQKHLGARIEVGPRKDAEPIQFEVHLQTTQTATGRVVDNHNRPIAHARVVLSADVRLSKSGTMTSSRPVQIGYPILTDRSGKFSIPNVVPGVGHTVSASSRGCAESQARFQAEPGKDFELPDLILTANDLGLTGTVVDSAGRPVEGIEVWIRVRNRSFAEGPRTMKTGKDGKFSFIALPSGEYRLRATLWKPTGVLDKNGNPSHASAADTEIRVHAGEDVRVVLDVPESIRKE